MKKKYKKLFCPIKINIIDLASTFKYFRIDNFKFRKITATDHQKFFGIKDFHQNGNESGWTDTITRKSFAFLLKKSEEFELYKCEFVIEFQDESLVKEISQLLLAFRLYKTGNIYAPIVLNSDTPAIFITDQPFFSKDSEDYNLKKSEINEVAKIYKSLKKIKTDSKLFLALERLKFASDIKTNEKNSYIELVSILESLFLKNDNQELSFRFALIITYILSNKIKENISFKRIKDIYTVRSELVHSGKSKKYTKDNLKLIEGYVKKLIVWYLKNPEQSEEIESIIFKKLNINSENS